MRRGGMGQHDLPYSWPVPDERIPLPTGWSESDRLPDDHPLLLDIQREGIEDFDGVPAGAQVIAVFVDWPYIAIAWQAGSQRGGVRGRLSPDLRHKLRTGTFTSGEPFYLHLDPPDDLWRVLEFDFGAEFYEVDDIGRLVEGADRPEGLRLTNHGAAAAAAEGLYFVGGRIQAADREQALDTLIKYLILVGQAIRKNLGLDPVGEFRLRRARLRQIS